MKELAGKKEIIKQLKEKILAMEGFSSGPDSHQFDFGLGPMNAAFPGGTFPVGAVHEFISPTQTSFSATNGFISGLLSTLMKKDGICLWVSTGRRLFPPTLKSFGIEPHRVIFIDVRRDKDALWVMEQALKYNSLAAVVAELRDINFAESSDCSWPWKIVGSPASCTTIFPARRIHWVPYPAGKSNLCPAW